ncbi:MAG TPA: N-acetyltransferase [Cyanobacteria bacterium UBA11691]|nr:N-acetyltransferase [Cyanobacteria bacterium UBA11691]
MGKGDFSMYDYRLIDRESELEILASLDGIPALSGTELKQHQPDLHLAILHNQTLVARCSLWWKNTPNYGQETLGFIGHYAVQDRQSAKALFSRSLEILGQHHCTLAVAPIDGNTWRNYRWITDRGEHPVFFLEPDNPPDYVEEILGAGFSPLAGYYSALVTDLNQGDRRLERVGDRLKKLDITLRPLNLDKWEEELRQIYHVSRIAFARNFLYTPLSESEFIEQYNPVRSYINPELVVLAQQGNAIVGFLFALPDFCLRQRNLRVETVILKTVAILPRKDYAGLGSFLVWQCHQIAQKLGYKSVIHALMYQGNSSLNISHRYAQPIRQYTLFAKAI